MAESSVCFLSQTKKVSHHTECITERQTRRIQSYRSPACLLSCPRYSISKTCCDQSHGSWAPPLGSRMQRGQPQSERCVTDPDTSPRPDKIRDVRRSPSQSSEVCKHQKELRPRQHVNWNRFPADPLAPGQFLKPQKSNTSRCLTFWHPTYISPQISSKRPQPDQLGHGFHRRIVFRLATRKSQRPLSIAP